MSPLEGAVRSLDVSKVKELLDDGAIQNFDIRKIKRELFGREDADDVGFYQELAEVEKSLRAERKAAMEAAPKSNLTREEFEKRLEEEIKKEAERDIAAELAAKREELDKNIIPVEEFNKFYVIQELLLQKRSSMSIFSMLDRCQSTDFEYDEEEDDDEIEEFEWRKR